MSAGPGVDFNAVIASDDFNTIVWVPAAIWVFVGTCVFQKCGHIGVLKRISVLIQLYPSFFWTMLLLVNWLWVCPWYAYRAFVMDETVIGLAWASVVPTFGWVLRRRLSANWRNFWQGQSAGAAPSGPGPSRIGVAPETSEIKVFDEEQVGADIGDIEVPDYWTNVRHRQTTSSTTGGGGFDQMVYVSTGSHAVFSELLTKSYLSVVTQDRPCPKTSDPCKKTPGGCSCVRPGGNPGIPTGYVVRRIIRVEDSDMWKRYCIKRDAIRSKRSGGGDVAPIAPPTLTDQVADGHPEVLAPLDEKLNEVYLWHGTGIRVALSIAQNDFNINLAGSKAGTMYGRGAYLTESSTKADEYASDEPGEYYDGIFALLLVRACLGKYYYTTTREPEAGDKVKSGECDSVLGDRAASVNTFREFVVYDADQIYPEFVVLYQRIHKADDESAIRAGAQLPFHMELPVYWSNCHRNPHQEAFAHQYKVRQKTQALLQQFAASTATKHSGDITVMEAFRVEVSAMWNRYTDFKSSVEARDIPSRILGKGRSGGQAGGPVVVERSGVRSFTKSSDDYVEFCWSDRLTSKAESVAVSCQWKDQDWGNKKGRMRVKLMRDAKQVVVQDLFGVCRSSDKKGWQLAHREFTAKDPVVSMSQSGDSLKVEYLVGGGGGHQLHIKDFKLTIVVASREGEENEHSDAGDVEEPQANVKIARCMQPNELDGMEESGHALTSLLLERLGTEDCISAENLDSTINEMFLWHGTSREAAEAITASGFRIPRGERATHGKRFGEGAYLAEDLSKSLTYTKPEDGIHFVLLCRTLCGELFYTEDDSNTSAHHAAKSGGKDSVLANPKGEGPREFIVLEESQVYPEFILKVKLA